MSSKKRKKDDNVSPWLFIPLLGAVIIIVLYLTVYRTLHDFKAVKLESESIKTRFQDTFPGLDQTGALSAARRKWVVQTANKEKCSCGCGYTLAACLKGDGQCPVRDKNIARVKELIEKVPHETG
jgi:hypothetical protein